MVAYLPGQLDTPPKLTGTQKLALAFLKLNIDDHDCEKDFYPYKKDRAEATAWLHGEKAGLTFEMTCCLLGYDPEATLAGIMNPDRVRTHAGLWGPQEDGLLKQFVAAGKAWHWIDERLGRKFGAAYVRTCRMKFHGPRRRSTRGAPRHNRLVGHRTAEHNPDVN